MWKLSRKLTMHLREKGLTATIKKMASGGLKNIASKPKNLKEKLTEQIDLHNKSYAHISRLVLEMNNGVHPKHQILNYHQFFLDYINFQDCVLDLGCGTGHLAYRLAQKSGEVIGIDINPGNIASAQANYIHPNLQFITGDATAFVHKKTVDKIVLSNVLEHIEDRKTFLDNLHSIAKVILLRVPLITRDWLAYYKRGNGYEYRLDSTHFTEYTPQELEKELAASDWKIEKGQTNWGEFWGKIISTK